MLCKSKDSEDQACKNKARYMADVNNKNIDVCPECMTRLLNENNKEKCENE